MQSMLDALCALVSSAVMLVITLSIIPFLCRLFIPVLGDAIWRGYCQVLIWCVVAPVRLVRFLVREATRRH